MGSASRSPVLNMVDPRASTCPAAPAREHERAGGPGLQAARENAQDFAVDPSGEEQQPGGKLGEDDQHGGIGLRVGIDGGGKAVAGLQAHHLRSHGQRFADKRHGQPDADA